MAGIRTLGLIACAVALAGCNGTESSSASNSTADPAGPTSSAEAPSTVPTTASALSPADSAAELCSGAVGNGGQSVENSELIETSGIAASGLSAGRLWAHNDSGDSARVFGVGFDDQTADGGQWTVEGVEATDWEDIAIGPGPTEGTPYLFVADIGDNRADRESVTITRFPEPEQWGSGGTVEDSDQFELIYPDHPHDAEAFLVDPITGDWYIITKEWQTGISDVFRAGASEVSEPGAGDQGIILEHVGTVDLRPYGFWASAADVSPDGALIGIRTYPGVTLYPRDPDEPLESAFTAEPCRAPSSLERQGEAMAFLTDDSYATVSEGLNRTISIFEIPEP